MNGFCKLASITFLIIVFSTHLFTPPYIAFFSAQNCRFEQVVPYNKG